VRPTIKEQLRETRRILKDVISPYVRDEHPAMLLSYLLSNLQMLENSWSRVLPFLHWDNTATGALLQTLARKVDVALENDILAALDAAPADVFDNEAVEQRNELLRELLSRCVMMCDAADLAALRAHLLERTSRFPLRPAALPLSATNKTTPAD
jgi:hypothetical protein